jgi:hypothetical protein
LIHFQLQFLSVQLRGEYITFSCQTWFLPQSRVHDCGGAVRETRPLGQPL